MEGVISYLRTAAEIKSLVSLGVKKVLELLNLRKVRVRLRLLMRYLLLEKKKDRDYLNRVSKKMIAWQEARDAEQLNAAVLLYHNNGARALHGFRYQLINYTKKARDTYTIQRKTFTQRERGQWLKKIAITHKEELQQAGLTQHDIEEIISKGKTPPGYDVHHRIALDDGGTNDFDNLILLRNDIEHRSIHGYYNPGELSIKLLSPNESIQVALPIPPANAIIYPNLQRGFYSEQVPNSQLVELYDID